MRVVSAGIPVEKLLEDPSSDLGKSTSVEFCGGTYEHISSHRCIQKRFRHLKNVGHIGHLVISSEEAIAKGIRRIVALTGPEAERALARADRLEKRATELNERIKANKDIVNDRAAFKNTGKEINEFVEVLFLREQLFQLFDIVKEVNQSLLPYWRKDAIRELAKASQKLLDSYDRQAKAAIAEQVLKEAKEVNENGIDGNYFVHVFSAGANGKALDAAVKAIQKPVAVMGFSLNDDIGKVVVVAKVNKVIAARPAAPLEH